MSETQGGVGDGGELSEATSHEAMGHAADTLDRLDVAVAITGENRWSSTSTSSPPQANRSGEPLPA